MNHATANTILLRNARTVLPDRTAQSTSLLIEDGRIARIFSSSEESAKAETIIDLAGLTLFPGFFDVHIHGAVGVDAMEASADDLSRVAEFLAQNGVTAWLLTVVPSTPKHYEHAIAAVGELMKLQSDDRGGRPCSQLLGVHYEGPFVNSEQCGALHREHFRTFTDASDLDALPTLKSQNTVHMMTLAPEVEGGVALVTELNKRGWIISIGHTRATVEVLDQALQAGARHMTHFMNAMPSLHHRAPGPVGWGLIHDDVTCDLIADGIHIDPSILKLILHTKTAERVSLISDAIAAAGLGDGEYQIWGEKIVVKEGRTQNTRGHIAGSVITMLDAVRMMLSLGVAEFEVGRMAALNPARLLRIDRDYGSIEEGKRADLVAVDNDGNARLTIIGGRIAYQSS